MHRQRPANRPTVRASLCLALALAASACNALPPTGEASASAAAAANPVLSAFAPPATDAPKLYSRDGGVVSAEAPGQVQKKTELPASPGPDGTSRMKVIELYQQAVEDRERLRQEVADLMASLERSQSLVAELQASLHEKEGSHSLADGDRQRLAQENADLAARLATAQIRRLEAEKSLLECMLAAPGADAGAQPAAAAFANPSAHGSAPAAPAKSLAKETREHDEHP